MRTRPARNLLFPDRGRLNEPPRFAVFAFSRAEPYERLRLVWTLDQHLPLVRRKVLFPGLLTCFAVFPRPARAPSIGAGVKRMLEQTVDSRLGGHFRYLYSARSVMGFPSISALATIVPRRGDSRPHRWTLHYGRKCCPFVLDAMARPAPNRWAAAILGGKVLKKKSWHGFLNSCSREPHTRRKCRIAILSGHRR